MDYEKAYKEALERAKEFYILCKKCGAKDTIDFLEDTFPELYESEDEKIRKELIDAIYGLWDNDALPMPLSVKRKDEWIAWLEKQRNTNETINRDEFAQSVLRGAAINLITWIDYSAAEGNMCLSNMECKDIEDALVNGDWDKIYAYLKKKLEKQGQVKESVNFQHENKTCKENDDSLTSEDEKIRDEICIYIGAKQDISLDVHNRWLSWLERQGVKLPVGFYYVNSEGKKFYSDTFKYGDVTLRVEKQGEQKLNPCNECINIKGCINCENGELKETEQKPMNNVETMFKVGDIIRLKDGDGLEWTVEKVLNNGYYTIVCADRDDFIQLDDKWELVGQKPAWSEEDEEYLDSVICALRSFIRNGGDAAKEYVEEEIDWLNKLKKRIGG